MTKEQIKEKKENRNKLNRIRFFYIIGIIIVIAIFSIVKFYDINNQYLINLTEYSEADYAHLQRVLEDTIAESIDSNGESDTVSISLKMNMAECSAEFVNDELTNVVRNYYSEKDYYDTLKSQKRSDIIATIVCAIIFLIIMIKVAFGITKKTSSK